MSCASRITSPLPIEMSLGVRLVLLYGTVAIGQTAYGDGELREMAASSPLPSQSCARRSIRF